MSILSVEAVSHRFGNVEALRGVDLTLGANQVTVLLGPSGAGKTTLLRLIAGLLTPSDGEVRHAGRTRAAMMFQEPRLIGRLTALQNVLIGGLRHRRNGRALMPAARSERQAARGALDLVGLGAFADARADTLSGGEQRRVALARALHQDGDLLIADEPIAHLDPDTAAAILAVLSKLRQSRTIVAALHQPALARGFADRIITLQDGRIVADRRVGPDPHGQTSPPGALA